MQPSLPTSEPQWEIDHKYRRLRWQVFAGIFIGYAGYYLVRNNLAMAKPHLLSDGYLAGELGLVGSLFAIAYGISKFIMGSVSDRSNARYFMTTGLILSITIMFTIGFWPLATGSLILLGVLLFLNGWFQGMGWPPSGRTMVHWFSVTERGTKMAIWNVAHNVGGGLMAPLAVLGVELFLDWRAVFYFPGMVAIGVAGFIFLTLRGTPTGLGLPTIEKWRNDYPPDYNESSESSFTGKEIFTKYILPNKVLWSIALANAFIYLIRYGVSDWAPTYLQQVKDFDFKSSGWAYAAYEVAGIPGTLLCGWLSDSVFKGKRAPVTILYMALITVALFVYWFNPPGNPSIDLACLISIGFLIYGPVMLIGVHALDLVPKNAAGTAAGFTGLFGYFLGTAILSQMFAGWLIQHYSWTGFFLLMILACVVSMICMWVSMKIRK